MPLINDPKFQPVIDSFTEQWEAIFGQQMKYQFGEPRYVAYEDQIYELQKQTIMNAISYDRVFTDQVIGLMLASERKRELIEELLTTK